ncbi:MAG: amidohydrolase [Planctomycetes bacterium]|nr:amidohydrolase [Planctomycetota bacterium]
MFAVVLAAALAAFPQDLVLTNAMVHTGASTPFEGRIVVRDGRIASPDAEPPPGATTIDLHGAFVLPGLQDAHGHLLGLGTSLVEVNLVGTKSYDEVIERVAAAAANTKPGDWVFGRGWDQNDWPDTAMPHHAELTAAVPEHPVWLVRIDGHAGLLNQRGLFLSGIRAGSEAPAGGEILLDEHGEPTGVLVDAAMAAVPKHDPTFAEIQERLLRAQGECLRHGLTCVHDAGVTQGELEQLRLLHFEGKWRLRVYAMVAESERELIRKGPWESRDGLLTVRAVKGYADGALGSRGAELLEPYADRPTSRGLQGMPRAKLQELAQRCADAGMQLCVHAIGDRANRNVLDAYAAVQVEGGLASRRFRIEHAQVVAAADVVRFRDLGVIPSMQPTHLTSDMPWAPDRLGPERVRLAYAWRSFLAIGVPVPFGSDFPVESVDPRKGLFAAVTTRAEQGGPAQGFRPDQKLTREEAIAGFTKHAAFAMFAEERLGTIEPGKIADLTVFDRDLRTCPENELLEAKVVLTVVGGQVVHDARGR